MLDTPYWLLDESLLRKNLELLSYIKGQTDIKILLALKGFALWQSFDLVSQYLDGCCASGLHEAILSHEEFGRETHTYSPAFKREELVEIASISDHILFNSPNQFQTFADLARDHNPNISLGLRVNPEHSKSPVEMYNPCGLFSRLGTTRKNFDTNLVESLDGLHFHALCEQDSDAFEEVLGVFETKFGEFLDKVEWVNFGGGHHITKTGYNIEHLIQTLNSFRERYPHLKVYLELGEAVGWETGVLVTSVLDIVHNGMDIAILDTSNEAHMLDTVIMPYRPKVRGETEGGRYTYRLGGNSCLAGDIMGDYSFDKPLKIGDKIIFEDQIHYTMVKATTFNGIKLPSIAIKRENGTLEVVKEFGYKDFKARL